MCVCVCPRELVCEWLPLSVYGQVCVCAGRWHTLLRLNPTVWAVWFEKGGAIIAWRRTTAVSPCRPTWISEILWLLLMHVTCMCLGTVLPIQQCVPTYTTAILPRRAKPM